MITGEELAAYAAGEADPALVARVESALPDDPELAARLARLRAVDEILGDLEPVTMTAAEVERLDDAVAADLAAIGAATDPDVVDLAARRHVVRDDERDGTSRSSWWDPMRLAGVAAALVLVVGVVAVALNGLGGDDVGTTADMAAAPASDGDGAEEAAEERAEDMVELPTTAAATEAEAATDAADSEGAGEDDALADLGGIPVIDDQRVVAAVGDIDPTRLRQRLEPLVELGAVDEPAEDETATTSQVPETESSTPSDAVGIVDGRVLQADRDAVQDCLPEDAAGVIVAEVIVVAPERAAIAYVLSDQVRVVDANSCAVLAELHDDEPAD